MESNEKPQLQLNIETINDNGICVEPADNNGDDIKLSSFTAHVPTISSSRMLSIRSPECKTNDARTDRCGTVLSKTSHDLDSTETDEPHEIFEYGFGTPFSYWKTFTYYEYVESKYSSLKQELLNNIICKVTVTEWQEIVVRGETKHQIIHNILGRGSDKNTAFAHQSEHYNELFGIKHQQKISLPHILSILFYTDLTALPREMKCVCRKIHADETLSDVKRRHCELVHWLRLLFETIVLYGNTFGTTDNERVYHGLNQLFYFRQFKAKFYIPTSTTTELSIAQNFTEGKGIVLEFGALETFGDPYFDTASLSAYPDEREYLFFFAELRIKHAYLASNSCKLDLSPLSLYQSIVSGNIMIDKALSKKKEYQQTQLRLFKYLQCIDDEEEEKQVSKPLNGGEQYAICSLKRFIAYNKEIIINGEELTKMITLQKLRERFVVSNDDKSFKTYAKGLLDMEVGFQKSECFEWENSRDDTENILSADGEGFCCSRAFKCMDRAKFYCQLNRMSDTMGRISLILYKIKGGGKQKKISFDLYCKALKFYIRFHKITFKLGGKEEDARQGTDFKLEWLKKAYDKEKDIKWKITISHVQD
eukprot:44533_1